LSTLNSVVQIFAPSDDDWIVTLALKDGRVFNRRVSPSSMSETDALRIALRVDKIHPDDVGDASVRRVASSAKLQTLAADDPFLSLVGRLNLG
jgi:hypothetical protein